MSSPIEKAAYPSFSPRYPNPEVVYVMLGSWCVFSGITPGPGRTSTINGIRDIITIIAEKEKVSTDQLRFFDLQTHRGYTKAPGEFEFDEVIARNEGGFNWMPTEYPDDVREFFREYVGVSKHPIKIWDPNQAKRAGFKPVKIFSPNEGRCFRDVRIYRESRDRIQKLVQPAAMISDPLHDARIVVDHKGSDELLKYSDGKRYCVWVQDKTQDN
jgi:hypothetical protein